jgi:hypothetical protein
MELNSHLQAQASGIQPDRQLTGDLMSFRNNLDGLEKIKLYFL